VGISSDQVGKSLRQDKQISNYKLDEEESFGPILEFTFDSDLGDKDLVSLLKERIPKRCTLNNLYEVEANALA